MRMIKSRRLLMAAMGACALFGGATSATAAVFRAVLTGDNVRPAGDPDGWGRLRVRVDDTLNTLCADLEVRSVGRVTSARIYRGGPDEDGSPVVNLDTPDDNDSDDCDAIGDTLADEIQANPAGFYVDIRTAEFPNGALRGQLAPSGD